MTQRFVEHTLVILKRPLPSIGLAAGTFGVVVHVYAEGKAYEVEFLNADGNSLGLVTVDAADLGQR